MKTTRKKRRHRHIWDDFLGSNMFCTSYRCKCGAIRIVYHSSDGHLGNPPRVTITEGNKTRRSKL